MQTEFKLIVVQHLADEEAVVENIVVGQRGTLGQTGGAGGELDVDRLVELQDRCEVPQPLTRVFVAEMGDLVEGEGARRITADLDHRAQTGQPLGMQPPGAGDREFGCERVDHPDVIAGLEPRGGDQRRAADLVQRILDLGQAVGGVDIDEYEPGLGSGELGDDPFRVIGRPDADAITWLQTQRHQAGGERIDAFGQFGPGPADPLLTHNQARAITPTRHGAIEMHPDGVPDHELIGGAVGVAWRLTSRWNFPRARCGTGHSWLPGACVWLCPMADIASGRSRLQRVSAASVGVGLRSSITVIRPVARSSPDRASPPSNGVGKRQAGDLIRAGSIVQRIMCNA